MAKFKHEEDIRGYCILSNEDLDALHEATLTSWRTTVFRFMVMKPGNLQCSRL